MLHRFFRKLTGNRAGLADIKNSVRIVSWYHPIFVSSHHVALEVKQGSEIHYLSFSPASLEGMKDRSLANVRDGVECAMMPTYQDELLMQGFRRAWPAIGNDLTDRQKELFGTRTLKELSCIEVFNIARLFPDDIKDALRKQGEPSESVTLYTLDTDKIIQKIIAIKTNQFNLMWAGCSGTHLHKPDTHNCASIVLDVLYEGGLLKLITSTNDLATVAGALLGAGYAVIHHQAVLDVLLDMVISAVISRGIGSFYEGYTGIQSFLNLTATQGKDSLVNILGLRIFSVSLGSFLGMIKSGPVIPSLLTLPRQVLDLARQAKMEEESVFLFRSPEEIKEAKMNLSRLHDIDILIETPRLGKA